MAEKRKSTFKAKVLTVIIVVLFVGSCATLVFAICTGKLSRADNTPPTETQSNTETVAVTETVAYTEVTELTTESTETTATEELSAELVLGSTYEVDYWAEYKDEHGSAGLGVLFGAYTQGVEINFNGGRFTVSTVSSYETLDVATGTFAFISDSEIELRYDNSNIEIAKVVETDGSTVTVLDVPMDIEGTTLRASLAD